MRVTAMLMVVIYHSLCIYGIWPDSPFTVVSYMGWAKFLNSIDMPIFFFLPGYLYAYKLSDTDSYMCNYSFFLKKFKRLMCPYLFWGILIILLFPYRYKFTTMAVGISHLWFLLALMMIFVIVHVLRHFWMKPPIVYKFGIIILLIIVQPYIINYCPPILALPQALSFLPIFLIGTLCSKHKLPPPSYSYRIILTVILISMTIVLLYMCFVYDNHVGQYTLFANFVFRICPIVIILISWILCKDVYFKEFCFVNSLDCNSMGIYIIHHILIIALIQSSLAFEFIKSHYIINPFLLFVVALFGAWFITLWLKRIKCARYILG